MLGEEGLSLINQHILKNAEPTVFWTPMDSAPIQPRKRQKFHIPTKLD
jgi:hypothetical protein